MKPEGRRWASYGTGVGSSWQFGGEQGLTVSSSDQRRGMSEEWVNKGGGCYRRRPRGTSLYTIRNNGPLTRHGDHRVGPILGISARRSSVNKAYRRTAPTVLARNSPSTHHKSCGSGTRIRGKAMREERVRLLHTNPTIRSDRRGDSGERNPKSNRSRFA